MMRSAIIAGCATSTSAIQCCFTSYVDGCDGYPSGQIGGLCNKDWSTSCILDSDCDSPPAPTPQPTPTPAPSPGHYPIDKLRFAGRWYAGKTAAFPTDGMVTSWGQSVFAKFTGSTSVGVNLDGKGLYYTYRIDGGPWKKIIAGSGTVHLADGLAKKKTHTLHFGRSDEASYGYMAFHDLVLDDGYTALVPDKPKLTYEALGDSITAGFKVNGLPSTANEDVYETYVVHLADAWGTDDWHTVARSGIGVANVRGSGGSMLDEYKCRAYVDLGSWNCHGPSSMGGEHQWDFALEARVPDVITVNLGTNDFAFGSGAMFQQDYETFIRFVRSKRPHATIFCICPLQYSCSADGEAKNQKWVTMKEGVEAAVKSLSDPKIVYVPTGSFKDPWLDCATEYSDYTHPTVVGHAKFAKRLLEVLTPIVRQNHFAELPRLV